MKDEISAAVTFLIKLIGSNNPQLVQQQTLDLQSNLTELLTAKFQNHWHPDKPSKGQAFRCIRLNGINRNDSVLESACNRTGLIYEDLKFPVELTLWIDPEEVTARFGEHKGSYCILAKFKGGNKENYVNQINIPELEQKSMERAHQASMELMLNRKKKFNKNAAFSKVNNVNGTNPLANNFSSNNGFDMNVAVQSAANTNTAGAFYNGYNYGSSPKYFSSSPPQQQQTAVHHNNNGGNGNSHTQNGMYSPSRMSPYRNNSNNNNGNLTAGQQNFANGLSNKFVVRNFHSSMVNTSATTNGQLMYEQTSVYQTDRYHWLNKSIVKA